MFFFGSADLKKRKNSAFFTNPLSKLHDSKDLKKVLLRTWTVLINISAIWLGMGNCFQQASFPLKKSVLHVGSLIINNYALSFYRSQNFLGWSKCFVPDQKSIYILWQSQTFFAKQKDDLHSVLLQKSLCQHKL